MTDAVFRSEAAARRVQTQYRQVLDRWPAPRTELNIQTRLGPTFVVSCGPQDAPSVVLLHGAQANAAAWMADVPLWASKFRLHAVDMIGEAGLSAPVRPDLAGEAHALWLDDVFAGLGLASAAVVGVSLGGWLALDYANRRPGAVTALALICPAGIGRQKNFLLDALPLLLLGAWGRRKIREKVFGPPPAAPPPADLLAMFQLMETIGQAIRPRIVQIPRLSDEDLGRLAMPVLAIVGGRDVLINSDETRARLERSVPHAEVSFIEDGYHFLHDQAPRVMGFLERSLAG